MTHKLDGMRETPLNLKIKKSKRHLQNLSLLQFVVYEMSKRERKYVVCVTCSVSRLYKEQKYFSMMADIAKVDPELTSGPVHTSIILIVGIIPYS